MPWRPYSTASSRVIDSTPPLLAVYAICAVAAPIERDEARDVHDRSAAGREHRGDAGAAAEPHALEVDLHHALPRGLRRVEHAAVVVGEDAGVVVEHVQRTERVDRGAHHRVAVLGAGDVGAHERGVTAGRADRIDDLARRRPTSLTTTRAPSAANSSAADRPMPLAAPVMSATFPSRRPGRSRPAGISPPTSCSCGAGRRPRPAAVPGGNRRGSDRGRTCPCGR